MQTTCSLADAVASGACLDFWLHRYQGLVAAIAAAVFAFLQWRVATGQRRIATSQYELAKSQAEISRTQGTIVAKQQQITQAQAQADVRSAMAKAMALTHPGTGKLVYSARETPIESAGIPYSREEFLGRVALAYPASVDLYSAFLDAAEAYQAAVEALPSEARTGGGYLGHPQQPPDEAVQRYLDAAQALQVAVTPFRKAIEAQPRAEAA